MLRRSIQVSCAIILLVGGIFLATSIENSDQRQESIAIDTQTQEPQFEIKSGAKRLTISGVTHSDEHEQAILQLAKDQFPGFDIQTSFSPAVIVADDWVKSSNRLLYALAATESAQAVMRPESIDIRGVTADAKTYESRLAFLREDAAATTSISSNVVSVDANLSFRALCEQSFSSLVIDPVSFKQSSTELRSSSFATLDRIAEFASDCQDATIAITGHTDGSGDKHWNQQLSRARAQAVADQLLSRGVPAERLVVQGKGASEPVADDTTVQGRARNRRIEFELR